ncbi:uncharacterized protein LOC106011455, partial [Aplysia californica]|uniref:Uncharacterized protein LOC106011455 n=1 Tax=Aplysia californica TaxID=6500 RepID=A0ABM0ZXR3_APLCA
MRLTLTSPSLGIYVTSPGTLPGGHEQSWRKGRQAVKSAPAKVRQKSSGYSRPSSRDPRKTQHRPVSVATTSTRHIRRAQGTPDRISVDDVVSLAQHTREVTSLENRRQVLEEAQKTVRRELLPVDLSRPHSVVGNGLQAMTSPMPLSARDGKRLSQMEHIPVLLPLPSDRTFIPSPDQDNTRHMTTPIDFGRSDSVARQCCEIMGASTCRVCRKLESRLLNREKAEQECPRMRISQQNIAMTQIVKRFFPFMDEDEIQDKIARGEISRSNFPPRCGACRHHERDNDEDGSQEGDTADDLQNSGEGNEPKQIPSTAHGECEELSKPSKAPTHTSFYVLAKLALRLGGETSTPLFFSDLKRMQTKILSGEVERKSYMKPKRELARMKSAVSSVSTASSSKSTLSKIGSRLTQTLMPTFVSPRKVKIMEEPKYKVFYEPPLLSRRKQIPNPSFFAGSTDEYYLPERLPDVIEFADSKRILMMEKQMRSASSMSLASSMGEETDLNKSGSRTARSDRIGSAREENIPEVSTKDGEEPKYSTEEQVSGIKQQRAPRVSAEGELSDHAEEVELETIHEAQGKQQHHHQQQNQQQQQQQQQQQ